MIHITGSILRGMEPNMKIDRSLSIADLINVLCPKYEIDTRLRIANFLSQVMHESWGFSCKSENLNYSAEALVKTWPHRFDAHTSIEYARQPEKIANKVYGGRMGNNTDGDGWLFRGSGFIQLTGRDVVTEYAKHKGLSVTDIANKLRSDDYYALDSACWYWSVLKHLNPIADNDDIEVITKIINGGFNGIEARKAYHNKAMQLIIQP